MRRDRRRKQAEELVTITHEDQTQETVSMIILEDKTPRNTPQGYVIQDHRYKGLLDKPLFSIERNDIITRTARSARFPRGSSGQQQLKVVDLDVLWDGQELNLVDAAYVQ